MLKIKTNGLLGKINITPQRPNEYHWENFEEILKRLCYCFIYTADKN